ncbi:MAG: hypothetical protein ABIO39_02980 [Caulobacteraceae bacterium]
MSSLANAGRGFGGSRAVRAGAIAVALSFTAASAWAAPDVSGMWTLAKPVVSLRTVDGKAPPLTPEAAALHQKRMADRKAGKAGDIADLCLPVGTPRSLMAPGPFLLLQTGRKVTFVHEFNHTLRTVYLNEKRDPAKDVDPTFMGMSVGNWDGDALVVETTDFRGNTWLDQSGLPKSDKLKVTERLRVVGNGATLEDVITIDDPANYTAPWSTKLAFKRAPKGTQLKEDVCALRLPMAANVKDIAE